MDPEPKALRVTTYLTTVIVLIGCVAAFFWWWSHHEPVRVPAAPPGATPSAPK